VVLRDVYGDQFTYAGLGSLAHSYKPAQAPHGLRQAQHGAARAARRLPLRVGSVVPKGTVLGHLLVPSGSTAGHMRFAIRPAGDAKSIDPRPILAGWEQLYAAVHPQGARSDSSMRSATAAIRRTHSATSALAARASSSSLLAGGGLTPAQWDQLIARISRLPAPSVATRPSAAAISDPQPSPASASAAGSGWAGLSSASSSPPPSPGEPTPRISP
jgi:hypothetical protein